MHGGEQVKDELQRLAESTSADAGASLAQPAVAQGAQPSVEGAQPKSNIMVVDDQPANLKLLEELLTQQGHAVRSFPRGRLALDAACTESSGSDSARHQHAGDERL